MSGTRRWVLGYSLIFLSTVVLSGCSEAGSTAAETSPTTQAVREYDLSRLSEIQGDFPPGFVPRPAEVRELKPVWRDGVGSVVSSGKPFTVEPPQCKDLLKPVSGEANAQTIGIRADGADNRGIAVGADLPVSVTDVIPSSGCDAMSYTVPDDEQPRSGTAQRLTAPEIDGATTLALKVTTQGFSDPEYFYTAVVDDRLYVDVHARLAPDFQPEPLLPDLLTKAVAAVRGQ
jgi:Domain of unknown function (DUF5642)